MGISKVTQICENNKKSPCGSCSLFGSQSMFVGRLLPARRLPATPPWHLCQDHRHLGTTPSFLHLNLKPAAWQGQRPLVPCWASLARTTSKKRSCCITDAVSCCMCFSCGISHQSTAQVHCWSVVKGEAISATLEATHENRLFLMRHQVQVLLCFLITSEKIYSIKRSITSPTCCNGLLLEHLVYGVLHVMLGDAPLLP